MQKPLLSERNRQGWHGQAQKGSSLMPVLPLTSLNQDNPMQLKSKWYNPRGEMAASGGLKRPICNFSICLRWKWILAFSHGRIHYGVFGSPRWNGATCTHFSLPSSISKWCCTSPLAFLSFVQIWDLTHLPWSNLKAANLNVSPYSVISIPRENADPQSIQKVPASHKRTHFHYTLLDSRQWFLFSEPRPLTLWQF